MGKKADDKDLAMAAGQTQQPESVPAAKAAENTKSPIAELTEKGFVTLTAKTREQLQEDALQLIDAAKGKAYAGAAGYNAEIGLFTLTIQLKEE